MVTGITKGALAGTCRNRVQYGWSMMEERQDNGGVTCGQSHGHIKPVGKDRKILRIGFKSILFPKVHCGNNMGNGLLR